MAAGLTLTTMAAFLATPKLVSNSVLRYLQAKWLSRWALLPTQDLKQHPVAQRWLRRLIVVAAFAVALEVASLVSLLRDPDGTLGVGLFVSGGLTLMLVLAGSYAWSVTVQIAEAVRGDAAATQGHVRAPDPLDWVWLAALVLFVVGTLLQFADAFLPDVADQCLQQLVSGVRSAACQALD